MWPYSFCQVPTAKGSTFLGSANVDVRLGPQKESNPEGYQTCHFSHDLHDRLTAQDLFFRNFSSRFYFSLKLTDCLELVIMF